METVKFKLNKFNIISSIVFQIVLLIPSALSLVPIFDMIFFTGFDVQNVGSLIFFLFCFFQFLLMPISIFENYLDVHNFQSKYGTNNKYDIILPKGELLDIKQSWTRIIFHTKTNDFIIPRFYLHQFEGINTLADYKKGNKLNRIKNKQFKLIKWSIISLTIIFLLSMIWEMKFDHKYSIPFLKIETVEIEGKYIKENNAKIYSDARIKVIIDSTMMHFIFPHDVFVANKILKIESLKTVHSGTPVNLKIRKTDYIDFIKNKKPLENKEILYYELKVNGEILLQKRGLKK